MLLILKNIFYIALDTHIQLRMNNINKIFPIILKFEIQGDSNDKAINI